ncbi:MAG: hypothetical protein A2381_04535 [Bdellovibrionales bacterium RIFOXYB1_FULL_37_110]|nr:MAG: hypothetical protein A2417_16115 [Bdellovibrionales bacterium RIFOXYC1_FULL_37_79]OFZ57434.1 MAG: hypothetical protein A2381_04535 [Bdellovibrionales bacterium RIFOXYB1_FULL_37_110]OFZ64526.1 MAG: hypothetical protein A2577_13640 [Bdellovibrionales bacterium RIFOXYD1_FULL_36_51]
MKTLIFTLFLIQTSLVQALITSKSIYGEDDRYEASNHPDQHLLEQSRSVAAMVHANKLLLSDNPNIIDFKKTTLNEILEHGLCPGERYADQYSLATCSGFLISPDTILTAGHCVENEKDCVRYKWIFDFDNHSNYFTQDNVYGCKQVIKQSLYHSRRKIKDFSLVQLDRPVTGRTPLAFNRVDSLKPSSTLAVIGHPSGLPLKIASNGKKQNWSEEEKKHFLTYIFKRFWFFRASLDSFAGNSGSPVINTKTHLVEGILIEGAPDYTLTFEFGEPCQKAMIYPAHTSEAEEVVFKFGQLQYIKDNF